MRIITPALSGALVLSFAVLFSMVACAQKSQSVAAPHWATAMDVTGLPNLHKVSEQLYRSAQPTREGMHAAEKMGIRTVLSLRSGNKGDIELTKDTGLVLQHVPMRAWNPNFTAAVAALRAIDASSGPVLVHCYHGADRTGMVVASYRMAMQNWSREEALKEMLEGGYGYHSMWTDIVAFIETVDVQALRAAVKAK